MLNDRDYMRSDGGGRRAPNRFARDGMSSVYGLIIANAVVFFLVGAPPHLCLNLPSFLHGAVWQIATAMFLHGDFFHILFNMYSLYLFGGMIAPRIGTKSFLTLYFVSGLAGNALWLLSEALLGPSGVLLGASGAVMGVIAASAMMEPDVRMLILFIPYPIKLRTTALVFFGIDVFSQLFYGSHSHVAYLAHIGGFLAGAAYLALFQKRFVRWNPLSNWFSSSGSGADPSGPRGPSSPPPGWSFTSSDARGSGASQRNFRFDERVSQQELDRLLDKISRDGINSLSEFELARLRLAREQMRGK